MNLEVVWTRTSGNGNSTYEVRLDEDIVLGTFEGTNSKENADLFAEAYEAKYTPNHTSMGDI